MLSLFYLDGKRCVTQIPINYASTYYKSNKKSERFVGNYDRKKKKNHACDILFLAKDAQPLVHDDKYLNLIKLNGQL